MDNLFFIISKLAWCLLSPTNLLILSMSLATLLLIFNKVAVAKWILLPTAFISLAIFSYPVSDYVMHPLEKRFSKPVGLPEKIDGIIVLGGGEELKLSLSWDTSELGQGGDRYIGAAVLAKHYTEVPVIFSGGSGLLQFKGSETEGDIAYQLLTAIGISEDRIIIESQSRNTYENFLLMQYKLPEKEGVYMLVTSAFHMPRAIGVARKQGVNVIPYPVDYRSNKQPLRQWDFDLFGHLAVLESAWREWLGLTAYYFTGKTTEWFPEK